MILVSGRTEYSDRKVIILPRYSIPCLPLSNTVVMGVYIVGFNPGFQECVLFRVTVRWCNVLIINLK